MFKDFISYHDDHAELEGFAVYPTTEKRPLVILCHAWKGRDDFICKKALEVASWGYAAFALDMYGKGVLGHSKEQNAALKRPFVENRSLLQKRVLRGYEVATTLPYADPERVVVVGFGFGGVCAFDLARCGVQLQGVVSVYGHFDAPPNSKAITAKVLVLHGYDDPVASQEELRGFLNELKGDWQAHIYGHTMHAFANPEASDPSSGLMYNPISAARAWASAKDFLAEIFAA